MTLAVSTSDPLLDVIPFDAPKHPRLPFNRFPKGGRAGALTQAARVAWITGKYLYKYRKKWLAGGLALSMSSAALFNRDGQVPIRYAPRKPYQARSGFQRSTYRGRKFRKHSCPSGCVRKRSFQSYNRSFR